MSEVRMVFYVTDSGGCNFSFEEEFQQGKNGVDAALEVGAPILT